MSPTMATMTATIVNNTGKSSKHHHPHHYHNSSQFYNPNHSSLHHHQQQQTNGQIPFPNYLTYTQQEFGPMSPSSTTGGTVTKSSSLNSSEAFLLKQKLILRSSSLYDKLSNDLSASNLLTMTNNNYIDDLNSKPVSFYLPRAHYNRTEKLGKSIELRLKLLSNDERTHLRRLLLKHFNLNRNQNDINSSIIPENYNEEDPCTWPSNWLTHAPQMILEPDQYMAAKPSLNQYQRKLIQRISHRYEPLVLQMIDSIEMIRNDQNRIKNLNDLNNHSSSPSLYHHQHHQQQKQYQLPSVPTWSPKLVMHPNVQQSKLSLSTDETQTTTTTKGIDSINSKHYNDNVDDCHRSSDGIDVDDDKVKEHFNESYHQHENQHRKNQQEATIILSSRSQGQKMNSTTLLSNPICANSRLAAINGFNKWSSKMMIYLRKN